MTSPRSSARRAVASPVPYDVGYQPPAPVMPVGVSAGATETVMVPMLVDTGADVTLLPADVIRRLQLPRVDVIIVSGFRGLKQQTTVHAATLTLGGTQLVARVVASDEALLGRDVLASFVLELDGPRARARLRTPRRPAARGPRRRGA